ncbi:fluoride efflux transporter CrcB [Flavobacterium chuncheonense]|uniref:Fluoride-specific ion channel FluC n=1 Tax=Flavobacterium chuncheonense TaxID=2026653 RepID=A0ABW5YLS3_9FLAO
MIKNLLLVALGGGLGSALRYLANVSVTKIWPSKLYYATFLVNIIGCLCIGLLFGYFQKNQTDHQTLKLLLITGFCGGFTTFSAFGLENYNLLQTHNYSTTLLYLGLSIIIGILCVGLGIYLSK